jgi:serine/threonine protein kinase
LTSEPRISAIILPFYDRRNSISDINTLKKARLFTRSLLQQLNYAHGLGKNVNDIDKANTWVVDADDSRNRSVHALLPDWNDARAIGETIRHLEDDEMYYWSLRITPPEALFRDGIPPDGRPVRVTSISAFDIWSLGVLLTDILYKPCLWYYESKSNYLSELFHAVGGETRIPVSNETDMVDVAPLVGVDSQTLLKSKFRLPLFIRKATHIKVRCNESSFPMLREEKEEGRKGEAIDFLQSIFKISPLDRPTAEMLLRHPFLQ